MLWRFAFYVEGKHLEKVLAAVAGVALNMETPKPVVNAVKEKGKVVQAATATSQPGRVLETLKPLGLQKGDKLTASQIRDAMNEAGVAIGNFSSIVTRLKDLKYLKMTSTRGEYTVVHTQENTGG